MERDGNDNRQFNIVLIYQFSGWPRDLVVFRGLNELTALESIMRKPWSCGSSLVRSVFPRICYVWNL
jgi:hypothetical protein